jgi:uncharacterized protein
MVKASGKRLQDTRQIWHNSARTSNCSGRNFQDGSKMRYIFFIVAAAIVFLLLKSYRNRAHGERPSGGNPHAGQAENMVRCVYCGVHLPMSESIMSGGKYYCCEAHRKAHQAPPADGNAG